MTWTSSTCDSYGKQTWPQTKASDSRCKNLFSLATVQKLLCDFTHPSSGCHRVMRCQTHWGGFIPHVGNQILSSAGVGKSCVLPIRVPNLAQHWIKILQPWVQECYPVLGLGSRGRLLRHFQTPTLHWINFSLRPCVSFVFSRTQKDLLLSGVLWQGGSDLSFSDALSDHRAHHPTQWCGLCFIEWSCPVPNQLSVPPRSVHDNKKLINLWLLQPEENHNSRNYLSILPSILRFRGLF